MNNLYKSKSVWEHGHDYLERFGQRLLSVRDFLNVTRQQLAEQLDIDEELLNKIETNQTVHPTILLGVVACLEQDFQIIPDYFFTQRAYAKFPYREFRDKIRLKEKEEARRKQIVQNAINEMNRNNSQQK
jgi:transcriptional regulator with XRE-family HTH domain